MRLHGDQEDLCAGRRTPAHLAVKSFMEVSKLHRDILEHNLNKTGVYRSQHQILVILLMDPHISQKEIATQLNVSTATIAVSVKKLEKGGYIKRIVDETDNRYNSLCLTEQGREMVEHSGQFFHHVEEQMFCDFTPEELKQMNQLLVRINRNLSVLYQDKITTEREDL